MINGYVISGYVLIWGGIAWYAWRTARRADAARKHLSAETLAAGGDTTLDTDHR